MNFGACANSSVRVGCCLLTMILRERTECVFMRLVYLGVQRSFYVRVINPWWGQFQYMDTKTSACIGTPDLCDR